MILRGVFRNRVPGCKLMARGALLGTLTLLLGVSLLLHMAFITAWLGQEFQNVQVTSQIHVTIAENVQAPSQSLPTKHPNRRSEISGFRDAQWDLHDFDESFESSKMVLRRPFIIQYVSSLNQGKDVERSNQERRRRRSKGDRQRTNINHGLLNEIVFNVKDRSKRPLKISNNSSQNRPSKKPENKHKPSNITTKPPSANPHKPVISSKDNIKSPALTQESSVKNKISNTETKTSESQKQDPVKNKSNSRQDQQRAAVEVLDLDAKTDEQWEVQDDWAVDQFFPSSNRK